MTDMIVKVMLECRHHQKTMKNAIDAEDDERAGDFHDGFGLQADLLTDGKRLRLWPAARQRSSQS